MDLSIIVWVLALALAGLGAVVSYLQETPLPPGSEEKTLIEHHLPVVPASPILGLGEYQLTQNGEHLYEQERSEVKEEAL
jgi:hypothetical protein